MNKKPSEFQTEAEQKKGIVKTKNNKTKKLDWLIAKLLPQQHNVAALLHPERLAVKPRQRVRQYHGASQNNKKNNKKQQWTQKI